MRTATEEVCLGFAARAGLSQAPLTIRDRVLRWDASPPANTSRSPISGLAKVRMIGIPVGVHTR